MPEIKLEHVTKRWAKFYAVDDLDLVIQNNALSPCWAPPAAARPPPCG